MLDTPQGVELDYTFFSYLLAHENINIPNENQILLNALLMRQLQNVLSEARSVKFPIFLRIIKGVLYPERSKYHLSQ